MNVLNMPDSDIPIVRYVTDIIYLRRMREVLHTNLSSGSDKTNLSRGYLPCRFSLFYLIGKKDTWGQNLNLDVRQRSKGLLFNWHNIELFAVPPARRLHGHAATRRFCMT